MINDWDIRFASSVLSLEKENYGHYDGTIRRCFIFPVEIVFIMPICFCAHQPSIQNPQCIFRPVFSRANLLSIVSYLADGVTNVFIPNDQLLSASTPSPWQITRASCNILCSLRGCSIYHRKSLHPRASVESQLHASLLIHLHLT